MAPELYSVYSIAYKGIGYVKQADINEAVELIAPAKRVVVIQAENPDADSLGSALALEGLLTTQSKEVSLYCSVDVPHHLKYLKGWDRVTQELPNSFDMAIVVDTSAGSLLEKVFSVNQQHLFEKKPLLVIDHHDNETSVPMAQAIFLMDSSAVATAQIIYELAQTAKWQIDKETGTQLAAAILSDSLGLTSVKTTSRTIFILAELVEQAGVDLTELDNDRRELNKKSLPIINYKGKLLQRIEYFLDNRLAIITIPRDEIETYSDQYNPGVLVLEELRNAETVDVAIAIKDYGDRITGKLRANYSQVCDKIAEHFGGGGHPFAAGFKTRDWKLPELKAELVKVVGEQLK